jgi:hypothetical protein
MWLRILRNVPLDKGLGVENPNAKQRAVGSLTAIFFTYFGQNPNDVRDG